MKLPLAAVMKYIVLCHSVFSQRASLTVLQKRDVIFISAGQRTVMSLTPASHGATVSLVN